MAPFDPARLRGPLALVLIGAAAASLAPVLAERREPKPAEPVVVPFDMLPSNHMVVRVKLNGKGPYRLVFDLGSPVTLLGGKAALDSGAIAKDAPKSFLFGVRGEGKLDSIELGELRADDVPVVVMDHPALKALGGLLGRPLDGILGYTFFARYKTTIDYQKRQMSFAPVEFEVRDLLKDLPDRMVGPKVAKTRVVAPAGLWGLALGEPAGGPESRGVPIASVVAGSPAEAAGLKPGDVLTMLDGRWTVSTADAYQAAAAAKPGRDVEVVVLRDGEEVALSVTPLEGI